MSNERSISQVEEEALEAEQVYLLMKKEYRISRNIRASWFFGHLNKTIHVKDEKDLENSNEELEILSIVPKTLRADLDPERESVPKYRLVPSSHVTFFARRYRLVFILDLSPSVFSVDISSGQVIYDGAFQYLKKCLKGLAKPFSVPGSNFCLKPQLYVTVIAYTPMLTLNAKQQVFIQGCLVTQSNVDSILNKIESQLDDFETSLAEAATTQSQSNKRRSTHSQQGLTGGVFDDIIESSHPEKPGPSMSSNAVSPDYGLINMLRYGILALQLLPENSSAGIVIITDGVTGAADVGLVDSLLSQLKHSTIACSFIQLGSGYQPHGSFSFVPNVELMQSVAMTTFGAYLAKCPDLSDNRSNQMNVYHKDLFSWEFQKGLDGVKIDYLKGNDFTPFKYSM